MPLRVLPSTFGEFLMCYSMGAAMLTKFGKNTYNNELVPKSFELLQHSMVLRSVEQLVSWLHHSANPWEDTIGQEKGLGKKLT